MSKRNYIAATKACAKAYDKGANNEGSVQAAINEAAKRGYTTLSHCSPCETKQPVITERIRNEQGKIVITSDCAVCGTSTHNI